MEGQSVFTHGAIVGVYAVNSDDLVAASDQYISGLIRGNAYLQPQGKYQTTQLGGRSALRRRLAGKSPVTNQKEVVDVYTAFTNRSQFVYVIQVVPGKDQGQYQNTFAQMVRSVAFLD
jgi:hypothetical protein